MGKRYCDFERLAHWHWAFYVGPVLQGRWQHYFESGTHYYRKLIAYALIIFVVEKRGLILQHRFVFPRMHQ